MMKREVNEGMHGTWWFPDNIALWDAVSDWERERLASMQAHLRKGMVLYDIGTEFGWLSAIYGQWCGHENMVLVEPGESFWISIRKIWLENHLRDPIACWGGFAGARSNGIGSLKLLEWMADVSSPEPDAMAYGTLGRDPVRPVTTIDDIAWMTSRWPNAITIDVEGAEMEVLKGAMKTLAHMRPFVWCSIHEDLMVPFETTPDELVEYMRSFDYHHLDLGYDGHEVHALFVPL